MTEISVTTLGLRKMALKLRTIAPELYRQMRTSMRETGELVAVEARAHASPAVSKTIRVYPTATSVSVKAGVGERAPHKGEAKAKENAGKGGTFRHPVYGNHDVWADQPANPVLHKALEAKAEEVALKMSEGVDVVNDRLLSGEYGP